MKTNPYQPPGTSQRPNTFAKSYRVDNSKTTLREFQGMLGRPVLATIVWLMLKLRLMKLQTHSQPGPIRIADSLRPLEELPESVRQQLLEVQSDALELGFHMPSYADISVLSDAMSIGSLCMAHASKPYLLNAIAGTDGKISDGFQCIYSETLSPRQVYCTSNSRPGYDQGDDFHLTRTAPCKLEQLLSLHEQTVRDLPGRLKPFTKFEEIAMFLDQLTEEYYVDKIERGIFIPDEPSSN